ncbi:unnamed protein product [Nezara viridula]|uniref:Sodium/calcium exchanger membrane region domain-containing protein n=2 Tax=Nezara viridula TaxID=85310 RepID=A0A9P0E6Q5_NEZVI|nr:unnamed protein product [Nezara viridula]
MTQHAMEETFILNDFSEPMLGWAPWDNCTSPAILDFPYTGLPGGLFGVLISCLFLVYMYAVLTAVCNFYLLPTLADMWKGMTVTSDVIGATIMAAAAATPELAISLVSTFWIEGEVGAEAIVGSATFNCLIIPGVCAFLTKSHNEKPIDIWPLTRDALMFCISLACLIFCVHGEYVHWYKPFIMVIVYFAYVIGLLLEKYLRRKTMMLYYWINEEEEKNSPHISLSRLPGKSSIEKETLLTQLCSLLFWPVTIILYITIPRKYPSLAIFMSLTWIAVVSYIATWMIIYIGYNLNIPDSLMALTVLGFGLGIPELLSSICAAKTGKYTMALCNAFGANTFNILLCLGLPWSIKLLISNNQSIWVNTEGLAYNCALILVIVTVIYASLALNEFVLDKKIGCFFLVLYSIFVVLSTLIEMNVFYPVNLPLCNIKDYYYD